MLDGSATDFTGPIGGNDADPDQLASACWALALLTEMFRNPMAAMRGPLERFQGHRASAGELLGLASPAALGQLAAFREVFASTLLPQLAHRPGRWVLGPGFTGSALIKADADLIAAGLLLDLKTDSKLSLGVTTMFQVIGYALLDFDDAYQLTEAGTFSARYAYLATWDIGTLVRRTGRSSRQPALHQAGVPAASPRAPVIGQAQRAWPRKSAEFLIRSMGGPPRSARPCSATRTRAAGPGPTAG